MVDNLHRRQKCCVPVNKCGALAAVLKALLVNKLQRKLSKSHSARAIGIMVTHVFGYCTRLIEIFRSVPQHGTTTAHHQVQSPYATLKQKVKG
ncbi:hypothetical protein AFLA70_10g006162 [Aspergillus flavus AF70]|nr:hypothetical protein AFLA70_10g006162 [Aspergillus flavus AF70]